jgi:glutamate dehydrogenase
VADLRHLDRPEREQSGTELVLYKPRFNPETIRRFKLFRRDPLSLTRCCRSSPTWASRSSTSGRMR